jgi:hypothetical protein
MTFHYGGDKLLLKGLIGIEVFVQFIELIFYAWLAMSITTEKNITPKRYYDWFITTPSMLFIFIVYLEYLRNGNRVIKPDEETTNWTTIDYLWHSLEKHSTNLYFIILLNFFMLLFGYLGEIKLMSKINSVACGFIPFMKNMPNIHRAESYYSVYSRFYGHYMALPHYCHTHSRTSGIIYWTFSPRISSDYF